MSRSKTSKSHDAAKEATHQEVTHQEVTHQDSPTPTPPTIDQVVDKIVARFDQNTDQKLTAQELGAVLDVKGRFKLTSEMVSNLVTTVDTNKDTFVDKTEWKAALSALDKNADGLLARSDLHDVSDSLIALVGVIPHHEIPPAG